MESTTQKVGAAFEEQLTTVFVDKYRELLEGKPEGEPTWVTSGGPGGGAYGTLEDVSAEEASCEVNGITIAAHAEHLRWAIDLVNDYFAGKEPTADWSASWSVKTVDEAEWETLKRELRRAGGELLGAVPSAHTWREEFAVNGALASYGHSAYHLGALRQLKKAVKGRSDR